MMVVRMMVGGQWLGLLTAPDNTGMSESQPTLKPWCQLWGGGRGWWCQPWTRGGSWFPQRWWGRWGGGRWWLDDGGCQNHRNVRVGVQVNAFPTFFLLICRLSQPCLPCMASWVPCSCRYCQLIFVERRLEVLSFTSFTRQRSYKVLSDPCRDTFRAVHWSWVLLHSFVAQCTVLPIHGYSRLCLKNSSKQKF